MKKKNHIESQLTQALESDVSKAVKIIYEHYYQALYIVAFGIVKNSEIAKDVMQDAIINIWLKHEYYNSEVSSPYTWMYNIVRNKAIDYYRKPSLVNFTNEDLKEYFDKNNLVSKALNTDLIDLNKHLDSLKLKYKTPLYMSYIEGYTRREISEILNCPVSTVTNRVGAGKRDLKTIYTNSLNKKKKDVIIFYNY